MSVKRFVAPDMSKALRKVSEALGPDAVILSSRSTDDGVEVLTLPSGYLETRESPKTSPLARRYAEEEVEARRRAREIDDELIESRAKRRAELLSKVRSSASNNDRAEQASDADTASTNVNSKEYQSAASEAFELDSEQQIEAMLRDLPTVAGQAKPDVSELEENVPLLNDSETEMAIDTADKQKYRFNDAESMRHSIKNSASKLAKSLHSLEPKAQASGSSSSIIHEPITDDVQALDPALHQAQSVDDETMFDPQRFVAESAAQYEQDTIDDVIESDERASSRLRKSLQEGFSPSNGTRQSVTDSSLSALQQQLAQVKLMLEQRLEGQAEPTFKNARKSADDYIEPHQYTVMQRLATIGLPKAFATRCYCSAEQALLQSDPVDDVTRFVWLKSLRYLADQLPIDLGDPVMHGGVHAFIGPSGAGKTSVIAKMVTRYALEHGNDQVAIISTDNFALGARASLETLGKILDVPVYPVDSSHDLDSRIRECAAYRLLLIDTPGMHRGEMEGNAALQQLDALGARVNRHLVLPSVMQAKYAERFIDGLGADTVHSAIITRVDEAVALGEIITVLINKQLPISYWADGPNLPEYLHTAKRSECIQQILLSGGMRFDGTGNEHDEDVVGDSSENIEIQSYA